METTFITVHDLSLDARIRYVSDSIEDILGYQPHEVRDKSCWEYFHPDEIPFARAIHGRGIQLDKAAVLTYCQIKHKDGSWVGCECVFTIVYDCLVASTSIYRKSLRSEQRAIKAPAIRRIFSSSPHDPRYHMLSYISSKFNQVPKSVSHEPRAALFLNRFTRTATIMYATSGVTNILGIHPDQLVRKSFYFCISEQCLPDAVRCLESAKGNDSIAYLRFWFRNPLQQSRRGSAEASDEDEDEGGVHLSARGSGSPQANTSSHESTEPASLVAIASDNTADEDTARDKNGPREDRSGSSSDDTNEDPVGVHRDDVFDRPAIVAQSSTSSVTRHDDLNTSFQPIEVEAVVSCTSDGMIVILRRAKPIPREVVGPSEALDYNRGFFASPWGPEPVLPESVPFQVPDAFGMPLTNAQGPNTADFMNSIREVAVFAWSLTGINGSLAQYSRGKPIGEALPPAGLPVWDPNAPISDERFNGFEDNSHRRVSPGSAEMKDQSGTSSTSEDEIVYRRVPTIPPWRPVQRRGHQEAFGDGDDGNNARDDSMARRRRLDH